jgi:hypothetical protein
MGDHPQELTEREDRESPSRITLGELLQRLSGILVLRRLRVIGVDEDVGIDRDQLRPSMRS